MNEDPMSDDLIERFRKQDWKVLLQRLLSHAAKLLSGRGRMSMDGHEAEDVVHKAIEMTLEGKRKWNPSRVPDLGYFLQRVIDSLISGHGTLGGGQLRSRIDYVDPADLVLDEAPAAPEIDPADEEERARMFDAVLKETGDDRQFHDYVEAIWSEVSKPAEIADLLVVNVSVIYEYKRKLRKIVSRIQAKA